MHNYVYKCSVFLADLSHIVWGCYTSAHFNDSYGANQIGVIVHLAMLHDDMIVWS